MDVRRLPHKRRLTCRIAGDLCGGVQVYAVIDKNADGIAESVVTVVSNLLAPLGLAYANGSLWVATTPTIYRFDNVDELALAGRVCHPIQLFST